MRRNYYPLTDRELEDTDLKQLKLSYASLRREYEDVCLALERARYVHEGPNGSPRPKSEVSPNSRLTVTLGERTKCSGCNQHFSGDHLCIANHEKHCNIRTSRDGWDADCSCKRGRP